MKKYVNTRVLLLFCLCALLLAGAAVTYAWYRPIKLNFAPAKVDGSIRASYFQSGDGSKDAPFEIAKPEQFYNLAWLQYLGRFNEADENRTIPTTYFYLSADIDMTGYVLPPVGTEKYPFVGNFDGKGNTVTGLEIAVPTDLPIEGEYEKPQIVGAFGVVGTMGDIKDSITIDGENYTYSSAANEVKNVTFKGLTVETQTANALIGLAAGYVNGKLTNVGIQLDNTLMSNLDIKLNTSPLNAISANFSDHSLVGYTKDVETDTSNTVKHYQPTAAQGTFTAKGETGDDETTGGGSLNVSSLYDRVKAISAAATLSGKTKTYYDNSGDNWKKGSFTLLDDTDYLFGKARTGEYWTGGFKYNQDNLTSGNIYRISNSSNESAGSVYPQLTIGFGGVVKNADSRFNALPWTVENIDGNWRIYTLLNGIAYYLIPSGDSESLSTTTVADNAGVWTIEGKKISSGGKYLAYNSGWKLVETATELFFALCSTSNVADNLLDTYVPLVVDGEYKATSENTGYIVGGTSKHSKTISSEDGDIRVLKHAYSDIDTTAGTGYFEKGSDGGITDIKTITFLQGAVDTTANSVYAKAKSHFIEALNKDRNFIYSLRFQGGVVDRVITAGRVQIGTSEKTNYQMPESCIDFNISSGKLAFFASSHGVSNTRSFFSLHQITRNGGEITAIKEISKIYASGSGYVYAYAGEEDPYGANGYELKFDTSILTEQRQGNNPLGSSRGEGTKLYYFEIPLNAGEYALGAVANGAALMYLDIGVGDSAGVTEGLIPAGAVVTRTKTTEVIVTEHKETSAPKGVDFVTTPVTVTPPSVTKATATKRLDGTVSGVYEFSTTNGGAACTHGGATETLGLDGVVTTAKRCIVTLTDTWQKDGAPVTRTIRVVYDGTNTTYAVTMNGETKTYTYNDLKDKADITGVGNGVANNAPKLPTPEEMVALQAEGKTVLEYTYTAADAVIDSVLVPTVTVETDGTVAVTGGRYTVTSNVTLTETKRDNGYTVTYNTAAP